MLSDAEARFCKSWAHQFSWLPAALGQQGVLEGEWKARDKRNFIFLEGGVTFYLLLVPVSLTLAMLTQEAAVPS